MEKSKQDYIFECENGTVYAIPYNKKCCLICKHCTDIWYDYTNGPYMFDCGIDSEYANEMSNQAGDNCKCFVLDENTLTVEEYEAKINSPEYIEQQKKINEAIEKLANDKEFQEKYEQAMRAALILSAVRIPKGFISKALGKEKTKNV